MGDRTPTSSPTLTLVKSAVEVYPLKLHAVAADSTPLT